MKIGHFSDIHSDLNLIGNEVPDIWVCTGDVFPNSTRGNREVEQAFQTAWFESNKSALVAKLQGAPLVSVAGNHDFVSLGTLLKGIGYEAYEIESGVDATIQGVRFAGFPGIPFIYGEWNHELTRAELLFRVQQVFENPPDVLVTHAPSSGILGNDNYGISGLTSALCYNEHAIKLHLFGHEHEYGGMMVEQLGVKFYNNACRTGYIYL